MNNSLYISRIFKYYTSKDLVNNAQLRYNFYYALKKMKLNKLDDITTLATLLPQYIKIFKDDSYAIGLRTIYEQFAISLLIKKYHINNDITPEFRERMIIAILKKLNYLLYLDGVDYKSFIKPLKLNIKYILEDYTYNNRNISFTNILKDDELSELFIELIYELYDKNRSFEILYSIYKFNKTDEYYMMLIPNQLKTRFMIGPLYNIKKKLEKVGDKFCKMKTSKSS